MTAPEEAKRTCLGLSSDLKKVWYEPRKDSIFIMHTNPRVYIAVPDGLEKIEGAYALEDRHHIFALITREQHDTVTRKAIFLGHLKGEAEGPTQD